MRDGQKTRFARQLRRNMTSAERLLWWKLKDRAQGWKFLRQKPLGPFVLDFACIEVQLAIEVDGATHGSAKDMAYDKGRTRFIEQQGWRVVRFHNREVFENLNGVIETIRNAAWEQEHWLARRQSG
ncbi:MAG TPA: endonuclease domain-containing protein [Hyphomonadaceae bacterium]|nr:endonuclease domain-containing protein [Hyphomonadaceae bacterium]